MDCRLCAGTALVPLLDLGKTGRNMYAGANQVPYAFGSCSDGTAITERARRVHAYSMDKLTSEILRLHCVRAAKPG